MGGARSNVGHGTLELLGSEVDVGTTTLLLSVPHESGLVCGLVGIRARESHEDLVHALGSDLEGTGLEDITPGAGGEVTERRTVDQGGDHLGRLRSLLQVWVIVTDGDRGDLGVDIEEGVAIKISETEKREEVLSVSRSSKLNRTAESLTSYRQRLHSRP